jgi:hypothetical protein
MINQKSISICNIPMKRLGRFVDLVSKIKSKNQRIDSNDILILACSISDKECKGLLTFDQELIYSKEIDYVVRSHVSDRKNFTITDRPPI